MRYFTDINNIYVTHKNHGIDPHHYLHHLPKEVIGEVHLAGHTTKVIDDNTLWIDHHGDYICDEVWQLYQEALSLFGPIPTLIEWDTNIPTLDVLLKEAKKAQCMIDQQEGLCAA
jgi:uncharacterized protein (UPF0276 family)